MTIIVNVDAGEGEPNDPLDLKLLRHVDAINIALGGHAGEPAWSQELAERARSAGKRVHLHPGYPDREGFGRQPMQMEWPDLARSLSLQRAVLPQVQTCKFHGAIYNQAVLDNEFAKQLAGWCQDEGINEIVTPSQSCLAEAAEQRGIQILREAFADRRYVMNDHRLTLQHRSEAGAVIEIVSEAISQCNLITNDGRVQLADGTFAEISCDTICIHGDGKNAIELAATLGSSN